MAKITFPIARISLLTVGLLTVGACLANRSLPYPEPERLVAVQEIGEDATSIGVSPENFLAWRDSARDFESVSAHLVASRRLQGDRPRDVRAALSTVDLFITLGVMPVLGRVFIEQESTDVTVLTYRLWMDHFAGQPHVIGSTIAISGRDHTVIGIMPEGFAYPETADLWLPLDPSELRSRHDLTVTARLSPDVTLEQAQMSLDEITLPCGHAVRSVALQDALSEN